MSPSTFVQLILALLGAYLLLLVVVYLLQPRLLFLPHLPGRTIAATPEQIALDYEETAIQTEDGIELHGWWIPAPQARATLLFFHGNAGNISHRLESLRLFHQLQLSVLIIDYRGYGKSQGTISETGSYRDARAAWRHLTERRGIDPTRIIIFGRSLGGAVAAQLATEVTAAGVILESTFTSVPDLGAELYPWLPVRLLSRLHYRTIDRVARIHSPLLIIHSREDEIIPYHHGQALLHQASDSARLVPLSGGHNDGFLVSASDYREALHQFIDQVAP